MNNEAQRAAGSAHGDNTDRKGERKDREQDHKSKLDAALERGLEDSFPGSDPVAVTQPPASARDKHKT
jgi:hypothetical protein